MKKETKAVLGTVLFVFDFIITGFVTCYLWNSVMSGMFGLMQITYWQGWAISLLTGYFGPHNWDRESSTDTARNLFKDIVYTLLAALLMWLLINFAGI